MMAWRSLSLAFLATLVLAIGCDSPEPVIQYNVPTELPEQLRVGKERMLAAILPKGDQIWFFKVTGPEDAIDGIESTYRAFVESIHIEDGKPDLSNLPEGWRLGGKREMRFASIDVDTPNKQLDISISTLGRQDDLDQFVALNVNRWRGQLTLAPSDDKWAGGKPIDIATADAPSVWVDLVGEPAGSGSMSPPFANRSTLPENHPTLPPSDGPKPTRAATNAPAADPRLKFDRPDGWRDGRMSSMRMAAFNVGPEDSQAELTVIPAGGDLRGNVARWLGQVHGGTVADEIVDKALADAQEVDVDGRKSQRFLLTGDDPNAGDVIDVTIVPMGDGTNSLFIKMHGPSETVTAHCDAIASFLESLKLNI